jgi:hypothetical protein
MTDSTIGVAEPVTPTKQLQSYQNTVSSQTVQAEGVVQVDLNGVPVPPGTAASPVRTDPTGTTTQPVSGSVSVSNFPATQPVSGTITIGSQPISVTEQADFAFGADGSGRGLSIGGNQGSQFGPFRPVNTVAISSGIALLTSAVMTAIASVDGNSRIQVLANEIGQGTTGYLITQPAVANASAQTHAEGDFLGLSTDLSGNLRIGNPSNLPPLSVDPQGGLQVNSNNLRASQERMVMLAEMAALNSMIASDNGPGARNYQELR